MTEETDPDILQVMDELNLDWVRRYNKKCAPERCTKCKDFDRCFP